MLILVVEDEPICALSTVTELEQAGHGAIFACMSRRTIALDDRLYDYLLALQPNMVLSIHGFGGVVQHNREGAAERLGESFGEAAGFEVIDEWPHYEVTGELIEALAEEGIPAADIELLEDDPDSYERVRRGLDAVLCELGQGSERS